MAMLATDSGGGLWLSGRRSSQARICGRAWGRHSQRWRGFVLEEEYRTARAPLCVKVAPSRDTSNRVTLAFQISGHGRQHAEAQGVGGSTI